MFDAQCNFVNECALAMFFSPSMRIRCNRYVAQARRPERRLLHPVRAPAGSLHRPRHRNEQGTASAKKKHETISTKARILPIPHNYFPPYIQLPLLESWNNRFSLFAYTVKGSLEDLDAGDVIRNATVLDGPWQLI